VSEQEHRGTLRVRENNNVDGIWFHAGQTSFLWKKSKVSFVGFPIRIKDSDLYVQQFCSLLSSKTKTPFFIVFGGGEQKITEDIKKEMNMIPNVIFSMAMTEKNRISIKL
jgi:hypothetical protein